MFALALASLLFTASAIACPNLSGRYKICKSQSGQMPASHDFQISQTNVFGTQSFEISSIDDSGEKTSDTFKADGKLYEQEMTDGHTGMKLHFSSLTKCSGNSLEITNKILNESLVITIAKQDNKLIQKVAGMNLGKTITDTIICQ